jgi:hypothetical protein
MKLEFSEFHQSYTLVFSEKDKCNYCEYGSKCPLLLAVDRGMYVISSARDGEIPTHDFCELYSPNQRIKKLEKSLNKKGKAKEI